MSNHEVPSSKLAVYATLCEVVYQPNIAADAEARGLGFHTIQHVGNGGPHAMICEDDHRVVVVVRGTERDDIRDLIADGRVLPRRANAGGWVHRGIEDHASQLWTVLQYVEGTSKELWFCGHSLGGAAATHLALAAGSRRIELPHLLTVGAPRVGTRRSKPLKSLKVHDLPDEPQKTFSVPGHGLRCQVCDAVLSAVHRTITTDGFVTRERICSECGALNTTAERVINARQRRRYMSDPFS